MTAHSPLRPVLVWFLSIVIPAGMAKSSPPPQDSASDIVTQRYWINAGIGAASSGIAADAGISVPIGPALLTLHVAYTEEFKLLGPAPAENAWDIGLMGGIFRENRFWFVSGSAGVSIVSVRRRGELQSSSGWFSASYSSTVSTTVGIPAEVQLFWTPIEFLGIGLTGFGNLNPEKSYAGVMLMLRVGRLH